MVYGTQPLKCKSEDCEFSLHSCPFPLNWQRMSTIVKSAKSGNDCCLIPHFISQGTHANAEAGQHSTCKAEQCTRRCAHRDTGWSHVMLSLAHMLLDLSSGSHSDLAINELMLLYNMSKRRKSFWRSKYTRKKYYLFPYDQEYLVL
jgi:hypothetical protein